MVLLCKTILSNESCENVYDNYITKIMNKNTERISKWDDKLVATDKLTFSYDSNKWNNASCVDA